MKLDKLQEFLSKVQLPVENHCASNKKLEVSTGVCACKAEDKNK